jgi:hypothetical protein
MRKSIIYKFIILIILSVNFSEVQAQTYTLDDLIGTWDFEAVVEHDRYISDEAVKNLSDTFTGAYIDFGDDDRHLLRFKNGYVIKSSYYYDWEGDKGIAIGTQQDGTDISGFLDSYRYQLIFIDKDHFLLKLYAVSFGDDALYQMKFKRFTF